MLTGGRFDEPQLSPDGRWLAYVSWESGGPEVYVDPFGRDGDHVRVSPAGGGQPKWRADGKELLFTTPVGHLQAVQVQVTATRLDVSLPADLFEIGGFEGPDYDDYAPGIELRGRQLATLREP